MAVNDDSPLQKPVYQIRDGRRCARITVPRCVAYPNAYPALVRLSTTARTPAAACALEGSVQAGRTIRAPDADRTRSPIAAIGCPRP
jgi:hypothetical protein